MDGILGGTRTARGRFALPTVAVWWWRFEEATQLNKKKAGQQTTAGSAVPLSIKPFFRPHRQRAESHISRLQKRHGEGVDACRRDQTYIRLVPLQPTSSTTAEKGSLYGPVRPCTLRSTPYTQHAQPGPCSLTGPFSKIHSVPSQTRQSAHFVRRWASPRMSPSAQDDDHRPPPRLGAASAWLSLRWKDTGLASVECTMAL